MPHTNIISALGHWEGYRIANVTLSQPEEKRIEIELVPKRTRKLIASCGHRCTGIHDTTTRVVRDSSILGATTYLIVHRRRLLCPRCGPTLEHLPWLGKYARVTTRLAEEVADFCRVLSVKHVADRFRLSWDQVKEIDKRALKKGLETVDLTNVKVIGIDEFALRKGHRYATVIVDLQRKKVLFVAEGRSRETIRPFFEQLGPDGCMRLRAVAMDMNGAFDQEVKAQCPQAAIVYDLFHVVAKYGREVIARVRNAEAKRVKKDEAARKVITGSRWLLLSNKENLEQKQQVRLQELLNVNKKLFTAYVLKDDLKQLWRFDRVEDAQLFWEHWYQRAVESKIPHLMQFARRLEGYVQGILNHCLWHIHTGLLEGINNKIKVMKRIAYGFRDHEYFFLKIKTAFPGNTG